MFFLILISCTLNIDRNNKDKSFEKCKGYTMECYSAIRKKEILTSAPTWMDLYRCYCANKNKLDKDHMILLTWILETK